MLSQKVWSTTEFMIVCYQYIQRCLSILLQQTQEELHDKPFKCVLYDSKRDPKKETYKHMFETIPPPADGDDTNNTTLLYYTLGNSALKRSCQEYKDAGYSENGKYRIILDGKLTGVQCKITGGYGWIVIQN